MLNYILEVSFSWFVLYLGYLFFLKEESTFYLNRAYLLVSLSAGLVLPLIQINTGFQAPVTLPVLELDAIAVGGSPTTTTATIEHSWSLYQILLGIYGIGLLLSTLRFLISIAKLTQLYRGAIVQKTADYHLVKTNTVHSPFSFWKYLFLSDKVQLEHQEAEYILAHEATHIRQKHTVDLLFLEFLGIVFWFNPIIFLYKTAIRDQHEYLADQAVLNNQVSIKTYGQLLIEQSIPGLKIGLVNHLIYSQLKKRINMMTKKQAPKYLVLKYTTCVVAFFLVFWTISCSKEAPQPTVSGEVHTIVDIMPKFPGCDPSLEDKAHKACADQKLLQFIYNNVKYPQKAKDEGVEGMTVVQFVVNTEGKVVNPKLRKDISHGCGQAALDVIKLMMEKDITWRPGTKDGKTVNVTYNIPIKFALK